MDSHTEITIGKELVYALNPEGKHVYIDDVENGLDCNCTCPACGGQLIARNEGKKNKHHFAHYNKAECDYVCQTNIHCLAEEISKKRKQLYCHLISRTVEIGVASMTHEHSVVLLIILKARKEYRTSFLI
jgi:hypothetical protein